MKIELILAIITWATNLSSQLYLQIKLPEFHTYLDKSLVIYNVLNEYSTDGESLRYSHKTKLKDKSPNWEVYLDNA